MRLALILLLAGCGGAPTAGMRLAFEEADVARAERAPDLLARAREARDRAEAAAAAGDEDAAADHSTEARLWLRAALVEVDRLELEAARLDDEREEETVARRLAQTQSERRAREATLGRERAAAVAREQMELAFQAAEARETRRQDPNAIEPLAAARAFLDRARLLTAAARALGAPAESAAALLATLEAAPTTRDGSQALREALGLHRQALTLLGQARAESPVTPAVVASLVESAKERGLEVSLTPDGAFVSLDRSDVSKMADLIREFPHGPVRLQGRGARRFQAALGREEGVRRARLSSDEAAGELSAQLPAYGTPSGLPAAETPEAESEEPAPDAG